MQRQPKQTIMELFKKKKPKEDDAAERQTQQATQAVNPVAEVENPVNPETENLESVELQAEEQVSTEETEEPGSAEEPQEAEGLKLPVASEIAATLGKPELEDSLQETLTGLQAEIAAGMITDGTARLIALGLDYERAVKEADGAGEIRGRNAAIEERLMTRNDSDGIPHPGGGHGAGATTHAFSIFDLARSAR